MAGHLAPKLKVLGHSPPRITPDLLVAAGEQEEIHRFFHKVNGAVGISSCSPADRKGWRGLAKALSEFAITEIRAPEKVEAGAYFPVDIGVCNRSRFDLRSWPPFPIHSSYHWTNAQTGDCVVYDGDRSPISPALRRASAGPYRLHIRAPWQHGHYELRVTLVQELCRWFDVAPLNCFRDATLIVRGGVQ